MREFSRALLLRLAPWVIEPLRRLRRSRAFNRPQSKSPAEVFGEIYRRNLWGGTAGEFYSGSGSLDSVSEAWLNVVAQYISEHRIKSVVDLGCGDFRVGRKLIDATHVDYVGVDVVPELVERNARAFECPGVSFKVCDIVTDELPAGELYLVRQVLQHLSNGQVESVLKKLDHCEHVLIAEHHPAPELLTHCNVDKTTGAEIRAYVGSGVYPDRPPFSRKYVLRAENYVPPILAKGETIAVFAKY